jgi:membrane-bound lytic murein transglycosylase MltF
VKSTAPLELPITFARHVGDLEGMKKRRVIRVLVVPSHSVFFYDRGIPHGISYEAFDEFQRFANQKLRTGNLKVNVPFIPVRLEQLERAQLEGVGDVVGNKSRGFEREGGAGNPLTVYYVTIQRRMER